MVLCPYRTYEPCQSYLEVSFQLVSTRGTPSMYFTTPTGYSQISWVWPAADHLGVSYPEHVAWNRSKKSLTGNCELSVDYISYHISFLYETWFGVFVVLFCFFAVVYMMVNIIKNENRFSHCLFIKYLLSSKAMALEEIKFRFSHWTLARASNHVLEVSSNCPEIQNWNLK